MSNATEVSASAISLRARGGTFTFPSGSSRKRSQRAGFRTEQVRYFTLIYPLARTALWFAEALAGRAWGSEHLRRLCWAIYVWDADLEPGRLAGSIGIRARKRSSQ